MFHAALPIALTALKIRFIKYIGKIANDQFLKESGMFQAMFWGGSDGLMVCIRIKWIMIRATYHQRKKKRKMMDES